MNKTNKTDLTGPHPERWQIWPVTYFLVRKRRVRTCGINKVKSADFFIWACSFSEWVSMLSSKTAVKALINNFHCSLHNSRPQTVYLDPVEKGGGGGGGQEEGRNKQGIFQNKKYKLRLPRGRFMRGWYYQMTSIFGEICMMSAVCWEKQVSKQKGGEI